MNSKEIRNKFIEYFKNKEHKIVSSSPMVIKDDPTLMFTNAGMNQFKEIFLGNKPATFKRAADTQKCLRVSGKHNDLEEVGHDTYHHTMFEMLGNWSFGDYFKKDAINWAWELLTEVYKIDKNRLYVTVFGGDEHDKMPKDLEAYDLWRNLIAEDRIIDGSKKDNFWEMGDIGPCGPCSEIHVDLRSDEERKKIEGKELVNHDHPQVIEIWNLVFIQFNRKANGSLESLPNKHIDTGMGFERLSMVLQGVKSNYDTDIFQPIIKAIASMAAVNYGEDLKKDVAMRVIADHLRAVSFAIADGQMPSNNKAGYVIRRILRRAVRYGYTFLGFDKPFITNLVPILVAQMGETFPELKRNETLIINVIAEEENSFLRTLETGLQLLQKIIDDLKKKNVNKVNGAAAFELYDTFGFPFDLTELIVKENNLTLSKEEFDHEMAQQKARSRADASVETSDMIIVRNNDAEEFIGYDSLESDVRITKYRIIKTKNAEQVHLVLDKTPFYAESGGQIGDTGMLQTADGLTIKVLNTFKENNLIIHLCDKLPEDVNAIFNAKVDIDRRRKISNNHSATHLLHHALRKILGNHVEQKGSLVTDDSIRFDFSHYKKMEDNEILAVQKEVNNMIRANFNQELHKDVPIAEAKTFGAMSLFGEKYGDKVRVVKFGNSVELCGGTHVKASGQIGFFIIRHETSIASGIRRIEAITADSAEKYFEDYDFTIKELKNTLKNPKDLVKAVQSLIDQNKDLQKSLDAMGNKFVSGIKNSMLAEVKEINGINFIAKKVELNPENAKNLIFALSSELDNSLIVIASVYENKPLIMVAVSKTLESQKGLHAGNIVRELAKEINGGGGGQPHFASAGGKNIAGIDKALALAGKFLETK